MSTKTPLEIIMESYYAFMDEQEAKGLNIPTLEEFIALNPKYGMAYINSLVSDYRTSLAATKELTNGEKFKQLKDVNSLLFATEKYTKEIHKKLIDEFSIRVISDKFDAVVFSIDIQYPPFYDDKLRENSVYYSSLIEVKNRHFNDFVWEQILKFTDIFSGTIFFEFFKFELKCQPLQTKIDEYSGEEIKMLQNENWLISLKSNIVTIRNINVKE